MKSAHSFRFNIGFLEVLLVIALVGLFIQLFPELWQRLILALDVRQWSPVAWLVANALLVVALVAVRYRDDVKQAWQSRQQRAEKRRGEVARARQAVAARQRREDIEAARSRRMY